MRYGMWVIAHVDGTPVEQWLKSYDLEEFEADGGQGVFTFTKDPRQAIAFDGLETVMELWKRPSRTRPTRRDGKPNRPLTLFSISPRLLP